MVKPLVSFIIPVLNGEKDIGRCLQSIRCLPNAADSYEVLIIDNGSSDRTHQIIQRLGFDFQIIPNAHVSVLRNRGADLARGIYLAFVDADVELDACWLDSGLRAFEDTSVVASGCFPRVPQDATWVQKTWDIHQRGGQRNDELTQVAWLPSMNLVVRRVDFMAIDGFNEQLETVEDVDLCYRLGARGRIVENPGMGAVHWGEARDLRTFWRKEAWRATGNLYGVKSHGLRWDELPSLGYPLYMLLLIVITILSFGAYFWFGYIRYVPLSLMLLGLPAFVLALNKACLAMRPASIPNLFLLYLVYGFARAYSIIKGWAALPSS